MEKRILSLLLAAAILIAMFPSVFAVNDSGLNNFQKKNTYESGKFMDVAAGAWYEDNVKSAYELGLMVGTSGSTFDPGKKLSVAQAVTLAARFHSIYNGTGDEFEQGDPWYQVYMNYAVSNHLISDGEYPNPDVPATRAQYTVILSAAFPDEAMEPINSISTIPGVPQNADYAGAALRLYNAGILNGTDAKGTFSPNNDITRAEVAAMVTRMADPDLRMKFALEGQPDIDTDGDGIYDADEAYYGSNPNVADDVVTDTDGDGLTDYMEFYVTGTEIDNPDSDEDGLSDYEEVNLTGTDPNLADTNEDGVNDFDSDEDLDGLTNGEEVALGTNPVSSDSDQDGLTDYDEVNQYGTDPLLADTDQDGASDGWEAEHGYNPLRANSTFEVSVVEEAEDGTVTAGVRLKYSGNPESVQVSETTEAGLLNSSTPGYIGRAFEFSSDSAFDSAVISFEFDPDALPENADPVIYYYNEDTQLLEALKTTVSGNVASAVVEHFSTYVLLDRNTVDTVWDTEILAPGQVSGSDSIVEIAFVIDYSASMYDNDPEYQRLTIVNEFIDKLRPDQDRAAVIKFAAYATTLVPLSTDKEMLKNAVSGITNNSGSSCDSEAGTNGTDGLNAALKQLEGSDGDYKYVIFLTDGEDTTSSYSYDDLKTEAKNHSIAIYSIGMGDANRELLSDVATSTGGKFYFANAVDMEDTSAGSLMDAFSEIQNVTIDRELDSNGDGISDYYTRLLCEGKLRTGTGIPLFDSLSYDEVQARPDYDEDGLLNGEEVIVKYDAEQEKTYIMVSSSPVHADTDDDGIPDADDTAPRAKGLAGGIIGALKICSYGTGPRSSGGISGHAFVAYTSYVRDSFNLYGILVDSPEDVAKQGGDTREDRPEWHSISVSVNSVVTIGGWAGWLPDELKGTWINNELNLFIDGVYDDQRSLTAHLTEEDLQIVEAFTKSHSRWTYLYNCSAYAADLWNAATGDSISAKGPWASPAVLSHNIEKRDGYELASPLQANWP